MRTRGKEAGLDRKARNKTKKTLDEIAEAADRVMAEVKGPKESA